MKKLFSYILFLAVLFLAAFPLQVAAEASDGWVLSDDTSVITHNDKVFEIYYFNNSFDFVPEEANMYEIKYNGEYGTYEYEYVGCPVGTDEIVVLSHSNQVYATEEGKRILDKFENGDNLSYLLEDGHYVYNFEVSNFDMLKKEENKTEIEVSALINAEFFEIRSYDETETFAHTVGAVYHVYSEGYFYVDYDSLDNTYFDAYGYFSYRRGKVPLYKLGEDTVNHIDYCLDNSYYREVAFNYEENDYFGIDDKMVAVILYVIVTAVFGFIIPAVICALGFVFSRSKKAVNTKKWKILAIMSIVWIFISILTVIIMVV